MGHHQGGYLQFLDHIGHREGLSGAGSAQQNLMLVALMDPVDQSRDRFGLVSGGLVGGNKFKLGHYLIIAFYGRIRRIVERTCYP